MAQRTVKDRLITALFSRFPAMGERWARGFEGVKGGEIPWTPLTKEAAHCTVALVTTAGVHLKSQHPFNMADEQGDFTFREIRGETSLSDLMITHKYYDHGDADRDMNIVFPLERLRELASTGAIGSVAPRHYGFMGHITNEKIEGLMWESAPEIARRLATDGVDIALFTPG